MKSRLIGAVLAFTSMTFLTSPAAAQSSTCGSALYQLQSYAAQVNQAANFEFHHGIPMRCGGNPYCGNTQLYQLNQWYSFQSNQINGWYQQLVAECATQAPPRQRNRRPGSRDIETGIDEESIEDLEVDDEDKTVVLRIPDNPRGFRPQ